MPKDPMKGLLIGPDLEDEEEDDASSEEDAAKDILAAFASKDATALSLALKRHYEACKGASDEEYDEED